MLSSRNIPYNPSNQCLLFSSAWSGIGAGLVLNATHFVFTSSPELWTRLVFGYQVLVWVPTTPVSSEYQASTRIILGCYRLEQSFSHLYSSHKNQLTPAPSHFPFAQVPLYCTRKTEPLLFAVFDFLSIWEEVVTNTCSKFGKYM